MGGDGALGGAAPDLNNGIVRARAVGTREHVCVAWRHEFGPQDRAVSVGERAGGGGMDGDGDVCPICHDAMPADASRHRIAECGHAFHAACLIG